MFISCRTSPHLNCFPSVSQVPQQHVGPSLTDPVRCVVSPQVPARTWYSINNTSSIFIPVNRRIIHHQLLFLHLNTSSVIGDLRTITLPRARTSMVLGDPSPVACMYHMSRFSSPGGSGRSETCSFYRIPISSLPRQVPTFLPKTRCSLKSQVLHGVLFPAPCGLVSRSTPPM